MDLRDVGGPRNNVRDVGGPPEGLEACVIVGRLKGLRSPSETDEKSVIENEYEHSYS